MCVQSPITGTRISRIELRHIVALLAQRRFTCHYTSHYRHSLYLSIIIDYNYTVEKVLILHLGNYYEKLATVKNLLIITTPQKIIYFSPY